MEPQGSLGRRPRRAARASGRPPPDARASSSAPPSSWWRGPLRASAGCPRTVTNELTRSALNSSTPSLFSQNVLHRWNLSERFRRIEGPGGLHQLVAEEVEGRERCLRSRRLRSSTRNALRGKSTISKRLSPAWAFLFPGGAEPPGRVRPSPSHCHRPLQSRAYPGPVVRGWLGGRVARRTLRPSVRTKVWAHLEPDALRCLSRPRPGRLRARRRAQSARAPGTASATGNWGTACARAVASDLDQAQ